MADDPFVREIDRIEDDAGRGLIVGVSYGSVTLGLGGGGVVTLGPARAEDFIQLYLSACWAAARDGERLQGTYACGPDCGCELAGAT